MSKKRPKRIAIKIGTRVLTGSRNEIDRDVVKNIADQVASLMKSGREVIIVSSGAIGSGLGLLGLEKKPKSLSELQAIASVGQSHLMDLYNHYLGKHGFIAGQILLTQEDFNDRCRFLNIRYTLNTLLTKYKAVPIINENDSISTKEIKCGDNDRLSYLVADLAGADTLVILTDVEGLYDADGRLVSCVGELTGEIRAYCKGKGSDVSTGGMINKLETARNACLSGISCVIARGRRENVILDVVAGKEIGTRFAAKDKKITARKRWLAFSVRAKGEIMVDSGAVNALVQHKKSLLPSGITEVKGKFDEGDFVDIVSVGKKLIARGLSNYSSEEIKSIKGLKTDQIEKALGYKDYDEVVHRDNLVIIE